MTNEIVKHNLFALWSRSRCESDKKALDIAIKSIDKLEALEQQPCEDCISRTQALEMLGDEPENWTDTEKEIQEVNDYRWFKSILESLPSVTPKTKWIPVSEKPQEGRYLCTYEHCDGKCIDFGSFDGEAWYIKPIAYMPLPQPYAESEE